MSIPANHNQLESVQRPLRVLIAGGGISGLSAAIFLRQAGHTVEIFESSRFASETGAAIHIPPNANGLLRRMGMVPEEHGANQCEWISEYRPNGEKVYLKDIRMLSEAYPYPWQLIHRVDLHNTLKDLATSPEGEGTPAIMHLRSRVVHVDPEASSLALEDGSIHTGDLIIGADGVHSRVRKSLIKNLSPPEPSGTSAFRFLIPVDDIRSDPMTAHFVERSGEMLLLYGEDRRIVVYPCKQNTQLNFIAMHPEEETEANAHDWDQSASKETMLACYKTYPEDVKTLLRKASPEGINLWKLLDHNELGRENWTHGKIVLIGDAAHAFLPHQGQGGAQAIEDAAALGALLPCGTRASDVLRRLELFVQARYDRATMVQDFTRQAAFKTSRGKHGGRVLDPTQFTQVNFTHDAFDNAHGILLRDLTRLSTYPRMPLSFGPNPSPRQDLRGKARPLGKYSYRTSFMKFKTHKSYLNTLLPSDDFEINAAGSWATATFSVSKLGSLAWLGGRGYSFFGLYIHDVVHTADHSSSAETSKKFKRQGDFLPVLFENMADPIITGREEINFPKLFATLDERSTSVSSYHLSAGWEGTEFCQLTLENLVDAADAEAVLQAPILTSQFGTPGTEPGSMSQVECFSSLALPSQEGEKRWKADKAEIWFTQLEGSELEEAFPTLANVVKGLRDIKLVEVLSAGVQASS
ncbi:hypothetical protein QTJ16_006245 [Diplocarpon rosae]|uniref:FAD-binding domain-containing protein n=1 Tax=Diplocarpon rosae TaxID=946125 RepID=A0AAD9SV66_9HELO|nr:hypothetical protein QTJ16_006245 [Diplocarpon rosae]